MILMSVFGTFKKFFFFSMLSYIVFLFYDFFFIVTKAELWIKVTLKRITLKIATLSKLFILI